CCAADDDRARAALVLAEARGLVRLVGATDEKAISRALRAGTPYPFEEPALAASRPARARVFPFVTFVPCLACARGGPRAPAGRENERRRALAAATSPRAARGASHAARGGCASLPVADHERDAGHVRPRRDRRRARL